MKVDCHSHLVGIAPNSRGYVSARMRRSVSFRFLLHQSGAHRIADAEARDAHYAKRLADFVASSELDRAVILAFDEVYHNDGKCCPELTSLHVPNDYVRDVCRRYPEVFLYGASVHPSRLDAIEELHRVKEDGAVLVKLLPNSHGFDPASGAFKKYYQCAADLKLPILFHCGYEHTIRPLNQSYGEPQRLCPALDEGAVVIVAHAGSSGRFHLKETFGDFLRLLSRYPQCYGDTSALTNFWRSRYLVELLHPERLEKLYGVSLSDPLSRFLYGSDYPIPITPWAFTRELGMAALLPRSHSANPLQRDIDTKRALGVSDDCLQRSAMVLGVNQV